MLQIKIEETASEMESVPEEIEQYGELEYLHGTAYIFMMC